jgi:CMP-N-acetylneuraminic acid synthetase
MHVMIVIPARGGSKRLPGKNLAKIGQDTLLSRAIDAVPYTLRKSKSVYVSTDSDDIAAEAVAHGAWVIERPARLAGDDESSESAVMHAMATLDGKAVEPDVVVMIQCTSPFIIGSDITECIREVTDYGATCAFTAAHVKGFLWHGKEQGKVMVEDQSTQEHVDGQRFREPIWVETGAVYAMLPGPFINTGRRFCGQAHRVEVPAWRSIEIDTQGDLDHARLIDKGLAPALAHRNEPPLRIMRARA